LSDGELSDVSIDIYEAIKEKDGEVTRIVKNQERIEIKTQPRASTALNREQSPRPSNRGPMKNP